MTHCPECGGPTIETGDTALTELEEAAKKIVAHAHYFYWNHLPACGLSANPADPCTCGLPELIEGLKEIR